CWGWLPKSLTGLFRLAGCWEGRWIAKSNVVESQGNFGDNEVVDKSHVIETLRGHRDELRAAGVVHLSVFGSVARGDASERSDVDLMADFDKSERLTLVKIGSLQHRLSEWLGVEVELTSADWMREPVRSKAMSEAVVAF
ncbi:MAG: nucleotidyltransferase domain-containing protein, partial [Silvibacterium sp.]